MRRIASVVLLMVLGEAVQAKTYRWVDAQGRVQYSDTPPPAATQTVKEVDRQGRLREAADRLSPAEVQARQQAERERVARDRRDRALMQTYMRADEIDKARDQEVAGIRSAIYSNQQHRVELQRRLKELQDRQQKLQAGKRPVPPDLPRDILLAQREIAAVDLIIARQQSDVEAVKRRAAQDKARWLELKAGGNTR